MSRRGKIVFLSVNAGVFLLFIITLGDDIARSSSWLLACVALPFYWSLVLLLLVSTIATIKGQDPAEDMDFGCLSAIGGMIIMSVIMATLVFPRHSYPPDGVYPIITDTGDEICIISKPRWSESTGEYRPRLKSLRTKGMSRNTRTIDETSGFILLRHPPGEDIASILSVSNRCKECNQSMVPKATIFTYKYRRGV